MHHHNSVLTDKQLKKEYINEATHAVCLNYYSTSKSNIGYTIAYVIFVVCIIGVLIGIGHTYGRGVRCVYDIQNEPMYRTNATAHDPKYCDDKELGKVFIWCSITAIWTLVALFMGIHYWKLMRLWKVNIVEDVINTNKGALIYVAIVTIMILVGVINCYLNWLQESIGDFRSFYDTMFISGSIIVCLQLILDIVLPIASIDEVDSSNTLYTRSLRDFGSTHDSKDGYDYGNIGHLIENLPKTIKSLILELCVIGVIICNFITYHYGKVCAYDTTSRVECSDINYGRRLMLVAIGGFIIPTIFITVVIFIKGFRKWSLDCISFWYVFTVSVYVLILAVIMWTGFVHRISMVSYTREYYDAIYAFSTIMMLLNIVPIFFVLNHKAIITTKKNKTRHYRFFWWGIIKVSNISLPRISLVVLMELIMTGIVVTLIVCACIAYGVAKVDYNQFGRKLVCFSFMSLTIPEILFSVFAVYITYVEYNKLPSTIDRSDNLNNEECNPDCCIGWKIIIWVFVTFTNLIILCVSIWIIFTNLLTSNRYDMNDIYTWNFDLIFTFLIIGAIVDIVFVWWSIIIHWDSSSTPTENTSSTKSTSPTKNTSSSMTTESISD